jgi:hypothetical protein
MSKAHAAAKTFCKELFLNDPRQLLQMMGLSREYFFTICPSILAPDLPRQPESRWTTLRPNSIPVTKDFEFLTVLLEPADVAREISVSVLNRTYQNAQTETDVEINPHERYSTASLAFPRMPPPPLILNLKEKENWQDIIRVPVSGQKEGTRTLRSLDYCLDVPFVPISCPNRYQTLVENERVTGFCAVVKRDRRDHRLFGASFRLTKLRGGKLDIQ